MSSQPIPPFSLAGATVGVPVQVSWQLLNLLNAVGVAPDAQPPVVELFNASGSLVQVRFPLSYITRQIPPNGWIQVPVSPQEVGYEATPLSIIQVSGINSVVGAYYPSGSAYGHTVSVGGGQGNGVATTLNQFQTVRTTWNAGDAPPKLAGINTPLGAVAYGTVVSVRMTPPSGSYPKIGRNAHLIITNGVTDPIELDFTEDSAPGPIILPQPLSAASPLTVSATITLLASGGATFTYSGAIAITGYTV